MNTKKHFMLCKGKKKMIESDRKKKTEAKRE